MTPDVSANRVEIEFTAPEGEFELVLAPLRQSGMQFDDNSPIRIEPAKDRYLARGVVSDAGLQAICSSGYRIRSNHPACASSR